MAADQKIETKPQSADVARGVGRLNPDEAPSNRDAKDSKDAADKSARVPADTSKATAYSEADPPNKARDWTAYLEAWLERATYLRKSGLPFEAPADFAPVENPESPEDKIHAGLWAMVQRAVELEKIQPTVKRADEPEPRQTLTPREAVKLGMPMESAKFHKIHADDVVVTAGGPVVTPKVTQPLPDATSPAVAKA